jgi:hypothetical protein
MEILILVAHLVGFAAAEYFKRMGELPNKMKK